MSIPKQQMSTTSLPTGRRLWVVRSILLLFGCLLVVGLEVGLRIGKVAAPEPLLLRVQQGPLDVYTLNAKVGLRFFPPEMERIMPQPGFQILPVEKGPNTRRIFVLGGSTTVGFPYHVHGSFPNFLRLQLEKQYPDTNIELINVGMTALNSYAVLDFVRELRSFEPDLFLVYCGHNEFYGALGPASAVAFGESQSAVQTIRWVLDLRIARLLSSALRKMKGPPEPVQGKTLMGAMVGKTEIRLRDDIYNATLSGFRKNLQEIVQAAGDVPIAFCEVVSNLRDQAPFASTFAVGTGAADQTMIEQTLSNLALSDPSAWGDVELSQLVELAERDSTYAETRYRLGQALLARGSAESRHEFRAARDHDAIRFRAPSDVNKTLREVANKTGSTLIPLEASFDRAAKNGVPGLDLFHEHLHPNLNGTYGIAGHVTSAIAGSGVLGAREVSSILPVDQTIVLSGLTPLDHEIAEQRIHRLTQRWPYPESDVPFQSRRETEVERMAKAYLGDQFDLAEAHNRMGQIYMKQERYEEALGEFRAACLIFPVVPQQFARAGDVALRLGRRQEALVYLQSAAALDPSNPRYREAVQSLQSGD